MLEHLKSDKRIIKIKESIVEDIVPSFTSQNERVIVKHPFDNINSILNMVEYKINDSYYILITLDPIVSNTLVYRSNTSISNSNNIKEEFIKLINDFDSQMLEFFKSHNYIPQILEGYVIRDL